ncbi:HAMP domain-containing methyl-accepting chemotaxis protein [Thalassotalea sp. 1_MG-2023]|uniref:methyl-accepting chemotaxis protein n=1 Tax=Thalassotalea sp. 1_MG-2023 TaxID=3062680 RepID=UPI0026E261C7|nr:HAMP domain-containing methyl-accepting chemotaxis protein [Thalassotalea sp. 1_MG-2023]MDO6427661.1 HAMP domain-containing methyl-accepting chemotaxis protein [Thalassotalea sp. 1_MG-2023]
MNFNSIRVRYTSVFCFIALTFVVLVLLNVNLVNKTLNGMELFGQKFNPAISAVLNADRDLYQARVAELQALSHVNNNEMVAEDLASFNENAKQAYDRMQEFKQHLTLYPDVANKLNGFTDAYQQWKNTSLKVFSLIEQNQVSQAIALSEGQSLALFDQLRDFYNIAGEVADEKSATVNEETIAAAEQGQTVLIIISVIVVILTATVGVLAPKAMADALESLSIKLKELNSGNGDLTKRLNSSRKDEIGEVANDIDELFNSLTTLIKSIVVQSSSVINGVEQLNNGAHEIENTSLKQTDAVDAIATAVNEMSYAIKEVAENAQMTAQEVNKVNQLTNEGRQITTEAANEMHTLSTTVSQATDVIRKLSDNSSNIASVLDVIRGIAEQTNLLALNAAIEAARAGEQGRGFAVVADEVRTLAARTQQSTEDIHVMIETLQHGVEEAVTAINKGNSATQTGVALSDKTLEAFEKISIASNHVIDASSQTATATEEQSQVAEDVSKNITLLADQTTANHQMARNNGNDAMNILSLAHELNGSVSSFKLD